MRPTRAVAAAKINLALVVGPRRRDGLHEVATVLQRIDVCDRIELEAGERLAIEGFPEDTIVAAALARLAAGAGVEPAWRVHISKEIPVAAGLGGGSADAAAALQLANASLAAPLASKRLHALAAELGADVPFFLDPGPKLAEGLGERLSPLEIPQDFWIVVALAPELEKVSTGAVYARFDELGGGPGFDGRRTPAGRPRRSAAERPGGGLRRRRARPGASRRGSLSGRRERRGPGRLRPIREPLGGALRGAPAGPPGAGLGSRTRLVTSPAWRPPP